MNQKQRAAKIRTPCEHETSSAEQSSEDISSLNNIKDKSKFKRGKLKIMIIVVYVQWGTLDYLISVLVCFLKNKKWIVLPDKDFTD